MGGAVIVRRMTRYLYWLQQQGAISPATALTLDQLGLREHHLWRRLVRRGLVIATPDGRYYLNEPAMDAWFERRRRIGLIVLLGLLMVAVWASWLQ